jgi:predicted Zn-dependent protease
LLFALLVSAGCQSGPRPAAEFVQQAQYLHDTGLRSTLVSDKIITDYFSDVGRRIIAGASLVNANNTKDPTLANLQFHLVASDVVNAYSTGGGHVYIYNGLLQLCESEEELAAIMAVQYAHALRLDVQQTGLRPIVNAGADPLSVSRVVFLFVNAPFSGVQCMEADKRAFEIYARAGWDPGKFAEIYERLQIRGFNLAPSIGIDGQPRPLLAARAAAARGLRQSLPPQSRDWKGPTVAGAEDFKTEVKARAAQFSQQLANAPDRGLLYLAAFPNVVLPAELTKQQQAQGQLRQELTPPAPTVPKIEPS